MQLLICGDPHGKFAHIIEAVLEHRPSATILLGDNTPDQPLDEALREIAGKTELFWIPGNHDTDTVEYHDRQFGSKLADRNLHGRIIDIAGLRVAGLGGVFRTKLWNDTSKAAASPEGYIRSLKREERWRDGLPLRHRSTIFRSQIDKLARHRADVLVTHEAPDLHPYGSAAIAQLANCMGVTRAFHGHHHVDKFYHGGVWQGVGLRGIVSLDGTTVRAGEFDAAMIVGD